jgi:hypothetical protein
MTDDNLSKMNDLDFRAWNKADWNGLFTDLHTDDVVVYFQGRLSTEGRPDHIDAMKALVEANGGQPAQLKSHPVTFGSGDWTCVIGEFEDGSRMVTVAKWRDGAIAEEHIWL